VLKLDAAAKMDTETGYRRGHCAVLDEIVQMSGPFLANFQAAMARCH